MEKIKNILLKHSWSPQRYMMLLLLIATLVIAYNNYRLKAKLKDVTEQYTELTETANDQLVTILTDNEGCAEEVRKKEILNTQYFNTYILMKNQLDSLKKEAEYRTTMLKKQLDLLKMDTVRLRSELRREQELLITANEVNTKLRDQLLAVNFNYKEALSTVQKYAQEKEQLEKQLLANSEGYNFTDGFINGHLSIDSTGVPKISIKYDTRAIKNAGTIEMKYISTLSENGLNNNNNKVIPVDVYRQDLETFMLQNYRKYSQGRDTNNTGG